MTTPLYGPRRTVLRLAAAVATGLLLTGVAAPQADAAPAVTGKLESADGTHLPVGGVTVRLFGAAAGCGTPTDRLVAAAVTRGDGSFVLSTAAAGPCRTFVLQVVDHASWQGGFLAGTLGGAVSLQPRSAALEFAPADVGPIPVFAAFVRGHVLDSATGAPVPGARVSVLSVFGDRLYGVATTGPSGSFLVPGVRADEVTVHVDGPAGYEDGWLACSRDVVPVFADGCTASSGTVGTLRLDRRP